MERLTPLHSLIRFYNQNGQEERMTTTQHSSNSSPPSPLSQPSAAHSSLSHNTSEVCYRVDLQQWLNLGQPHPHTPPPHHPFPHEPLVPPSTSLPKQVRHQSLRTNPPPVPPRRTRAGSCGPTSQHRREEAQGKEDKARVTRRAEGSDDLQHADVVEQKTVVDLSRLRYTIQSLWFVLLNQHAPRALPLSSSHPQPLHLHRFYDHLDRKILLPGSIVRHVWTRSGLPLTTLSQIWDSIDTGRTGKLNFEQFLLGMYHITKLRQEARFEEAAEEPQPPRNSPLRRGVSETEWSRRDSHAGWSTRQEASAAMRGLRRTPPLVPSSRSGSSVSSSSDSCASSHLLAHSSAPSVHSPSPCHHPFFDLSLSQSPTRCSPLKQDPSSSYPSGFLPLAPDTYALHF